MARPLDPEVDKAITDATLALLAERGFARMSMEAVATAAGVGKPAIYRRFKDKPELVAAVLRTQLPVIDVPDFGDTRKELAQLMEGVFPIGGQAFISLLGGLIAEQKRHPELIEAVRSTVILPRRAVGRQLIERGKKRGDLRKDLPTEAALDLFVGPFLTREFTGLETGPQWRKKAFAVWWDIVKERQDR